jgi:glucokinase
MITVGVDLGGTNLRAAILHPDGALSAVQREVLSDPSPQAVLDAVVAATSTAMREAGVAPESVGAVGIGLAGQIHRASGLVAVGPNLGWRDVPFGTMLAAAFPCPVRLENDLSAAVFGEAMAGAGRGVAHLALVAVGSGVGCGLIEAGRLVDGAAGLAGEIGHMKVVPGGEACGCGEQGCLEAYVGGHRLALRARRLAEGTDPSSPLSQATVTAKDVGDAFEAGDAVARRILEEAGDHLGLAVANLVTLLNPKRVLLGGSVLLGIPYLVDRVRDGVSRFTARPALGEVEVALATLGDDAGLYGAAYLARSGASSAA